ncbi:alpha/beta fold hydrolase, partial [Candidatus Sumerlaeota bacterium]|nr:alpha/beta fold hydrolase [Candidatus Sumerlaeota bacterium]
PSFTWNESAGPVRSLFYEGEPYGGKPTRVFAYYATPQTAGGSAPPKQRLPGVVLVHGGGGTAFREWAQIWAKRGYAAIAMDLTGHQPEEGKDANKPENRIRLADGGPEQGDTELFGNAERDPSEQWPYHAVADVIRAHSLLLSFPEVDPNRTAITGISWGGYLTCIAAGVDHRFKAAVPVYGCGFLHENSAWLDRLNKMSEPQRNRWVRLWDPSRYLPSVSMPILFVNGTNDFAYPLDSYMKSFDAVHGEKQLCVTVNMPHGHQAGWAPKEIGLFIDQYLTKGTPLPKIGDPKVESGRARAPYSGQTKIAKGSLHYTTGGGPINKRDWTTVEARVERSEISAGAPPENVTAWYMSVEDKRGAVVTTRVIFNPPR